MVWNDRRYAIWVVLVSLAPWASGEGGIEETRIYDPRPGFPSTTTSAAQPRIIGGDNADQYRYPYMVSLVDLFGAHACGGTLVAPDVVLTAAHCQGSTARAEIGRWNRADDNDDYDDIDVASPVYVNPEYSSEGFPHDFMLLKLSHQTTRPIVKLNQDGDLPTGQSEDELTVVGFGNTISGVTSLSHVLQQVDITYVPNQECEKSADARLGLTYQNQITETMLCAGDDGEDSCQGDSGGPLIISGGSSDLDIQVGVISWGFGCALPGFPGVYARVSAEMEWLTRTICDISDAVPDYLDCEATAPIPTIPVMVMIQFDDFPKETGWSIESATDGTVLVDVPAGTYQDAGNRVQQTVYLPAGGDYIFHITDTFGDGLCCNSAGNYLITLGQEPNGEVLVSGEGKFESEQQHVFTLPSEYEDSSGVDTPTVNEGEIALTVVIQMDDSPTEIGWKMDNLEIITETVIEMTVGIYGTPYEKIVRTIILEEHELYYFRLYDAGSNGMDGGYVQLYLGTTEEDPSKLLYEADGDFDSGVEFSFLTTISTEPTPAPGLDGENYLTLNLYLDLYPGEIGVQVRASDAGTAVSRQDLEQNSVIFFRPPTYYADYPNQMITETIPLPYTEPGASRYFSLIVTDSFADGLCCNWNRTVETGYILYEGNPANNIVVASSAFMGLDREMTIFSIGNSANDTTTLPPTSADDLIDIKVTITLDLFPDETGFYIEDLAGNRVVDVPTGTFMVQNQIIEQNFSIPAGVYNFAILDEYGDGLTIDDGYYRIDILKDDERSAVVTGTGVFVAQQIHPFLLEGKSAEYTMEVKFTSDDKPTEFGFYIDRLDVLEVDARVASVPQGSYTAANAEVSETFMVSEGGLYRLVFEDTGKDGIGSDIVITVSNGETDSQSYVVNGLTLNTAQIKVHTGTSTTTQADAISLNLHIKFDDYPHEVEWILVGNTDQSGGSVASLRDQQVVAYGPIEPYSNSLANMELVETILLPPHDGEMLFTMIVTDSAGDGVCCNFGSGGPVRLYKGTSDSGELLFSQPFEGRDRLVESFTIMGTGSTTESASSRTPCHGLLVFGVLVGMLLI